jgi:MoaA/NifB/PqqE/SkfB family radical SAM enzyme
MTESPAQLKTVHWRINCLCDTRCSFCFGPEALHEVDPEVCIPVLDKMIRYGIDTFVITGGEPLLSKRLDRVLRHLHANNVKVVLYTNCTYWDFHEETLLECVDTLCVPVEGASEMVHDSVRGMNSLRAVQGVLDRYAVGDGGPFTVRAGTVVGRHNLNELPAIGYLLDNYKLEYWALYQHPRYTDRVLGKHFRESQLGVSFAEYEAATATVLSRQGKTQIRMASDLAREGDFFMMSPELEIVIPTREDSGALSDKILCDAKESAVPDIVSVWQDSVDWQRYSQNLMISL